MHLSDPGELRGVRGGGLGAGPHDSCPTLTNWASAKQLERFPSIRKTGPIGLSILQGVVKVKSNNVHEIVLGTVKPIDS